jgi:hypothetical protein
MSRGQRDGSLRPYYWFCSFTPPQLIELGGAAGNWGPEENTGNLASTIRAPAQIRTANLPNASQKLCLYAISFSGALLGLNRI